MAMHHRVLATILAGVGGLLATVMLYPVWRDQQWRGFAEYSSFLLIGAGLLAAFWRAATVRALLARAAFAFAAIWMLSPVGGWFYNPERALTFLVMGAFVASVLVGVGLLLRKGDRP